MFTNKKLRSLNLFKTIESNYQLFVDSRIILPVLTQLPITCSKLIIKTPEPRH